MNKLLLHTCCAPCITVPLERLQSEFEITGFFYNPNIHPEQEYKKRLHEIKRWTQQTGIPLIVQNYETSRWFELVKGLEDEPEGGKRCDVCFRMRLEQTAALAKQKGFDCFTTTLSISPHKNATAINLVGNEVGKKFGVQFFEANFKKKDGFKQSVELSKNYGFYRQDYCGCIYSRR
ncbi:epoxyqueuosine reductase QueH [candidate division KSB1 bacterium]|nr:epoxyqueuosine reductase QueH [candidate division KSB1 bacterium]MBL7093412.1 epoxyqueuosine reductase QueH [candidate division KSB1 bacterium]